MAEAGGPSARLLALEKGLEAPEDAEEQTVPGTWRWCLVTGDKTGI